MRRRTQKSVRLSFHACAYSCHPPSACRRRSSFQVETREAPHHDALWLGKSACERCCILAAIPTSTAASLNAAATEGGDIGDAGELGSGGEPRAESEGDRGDLGGEAGARGGLSILEGAPKLNPGFPQVRGSSPYVYYV